MRSRRSGSRSGPRATTSSTSPRPWIERSRRCASTRASLRSPVASGTSRSSCASATGTWARRAATSTRSPSRGSRSSPPTPLSLALSPEGERGRDAPSPGLWSLLGEIRVRVVAAVRPQEVGDDVAVVTPGHVHVLAIGGARDVVTHVCGRDQRVEIREGIDAGKRATGHALGLPAVAVARVGDEDVQLAIAIRGGADLVVRDVQATVVPGKRWLSFIVGARGHEGRVADEPSRAVELSQPDVAVPRAVAAVVPCHVEVALEHSKGWELRIAHVLRRRKDERADLGRGCDRDDGAG